MSSLPAVRCDPTGRAFAWTSAILAAILLREALRDPFQLWRSWPVVVAVTCLALRACSAKARSAILILATAYLLGVYVHGQWPHLRAVFGIGE